MTYPIHTLAASIGKETTFGVAVSPSYSIPVTQPVFADDEQPQADESWQGSFAASYGHTPGPLQAALTLGGPVYVDTIGFPLAGILGDITTTPGTPNLHQIALMNAGTQPPSFTVHSADAMNCLRWAGCKFASVTIKAAAESPLEWTSTLVGLSGVPVDAPTTNYTAEPMLAGWQGAVQIGGITDVYVMSASVTLARNIVAQRNTDGTLAPWNLRAEQLAVTGTIAVAMQSDAYRALYVQGGSTSLDLDFLIGSGASTRELDLHCAQVTLTAAARSYGQNWVEVDLAFVADGNTLDAGASGGQSPIAVTLQNLVGSGVYA